MMLHRFLLLCWVALTPALAAATPDGTPARVEVLTGWRDAGTHIAGLRITLAPGWKTYWRAPGDAGIPPLFAFNASANVTEITPQWPTPVVFDQNGMRSIGYANSVVVPLVIATDGSGGALDLRGTLKIGVCQEICIPVDLAFSTTLPAAGAHDSAIQAALIDRPLTQAEASVGAVTCDVAPISDGLSVSATVQLAPTGSPEVVVIETADPSVWVSEADVRRDGNALTAVVDMVHPSGRVFALDRSALRITVLGSRRAVDISGCDAG